MDFKEQQKQLFYEIDHELVYEGCQELMRSYREGELSANTFYCDDIPAKYNDLPEPIRLLQPKYVHVHEIMVDIGFFGEDGMQLLRCFTNEFGQSASPYGNAKGWGFRTDPFGMDSLSGKESLDYLNEKYEHFEMELIPGLTYEMFGDEQPGTLEEVKQSIRLMDTILDWSQKTIDELAIKKQRLLYQTDHHELLKACQQVIMRYNDGAFSADKIDIGDRQFAEDIKTIPEIILNLEPVYVWLHENRVRVALIGGLDHAGVVAYLNSEEAQGKDGDLKFIDGFPYPDYDDGRRRNGMKLIRGLRYYDDGLREAGDDYKEYLGSLQYEAIPYIDWKRKQMNLSIHDRMKYRN